MMTAVFIVALAGFAVIQVAGWLRSRQALLRREEAARQLLSEFDRSAELFASVRETIIDNRRDTAGAGRFEKWFEETFQLVFDRAFWHTCDEGEAEEAVRQTYLAFVERYEGYTESVQRLLDMVDTIARGLRTGGSVERDEQVGRFEESLRSQLKNRLANA